MSVDALYAYAVLRAGAPVPAGVPAILPGAGHALVAGGGCVALVSPVPQDDFRPGPFGRLQDLGWLADRARAHRATVAAAVADGPVLPLAFGAVFPGRPTLVAWLDACGPRLRAALDGPPGAHGVAEDISRSLARDLAAAAHGMPETVGRMGRDADLDAIRAELARIGAVLASPALARRIAGRV